MKKEETIQDDKKTPTQVNLEFCNAEAPLFVYLST